MNNITSISGIYKLYWDTSEKYYIGQAIDINKRYKEHIRQLANNTHFNLWVQEEYNINGKPNINILEVCEPSLLNIKEPEYIHLRDTNCLNVLLGGNLCYGENSPRAKYQDIDIIEAFLLLYTYPSIKHIDVSTYTGIDINTVHDISACRGRGTHLLKEMYPKEWNELLKRKAPNSRGTRIFEFKNKFSEETYVCVSGELSEFCRTYGLQSSNLSKVINKSRKHTKGWELVYEKNI